MQNASGRYPVYEPNLSGVLIRFGHRIVSIGTVDIMQATGGSQTFEAAWKALDSQEALVCFYTGKRCTAWQKPRAIILDVSSVADSACGHLVYDLVSRPQLLHFAALEPVRRVSNRNVKIFVWSPGMLASTIYLFGPKHLGGCGNLLEEIEGEVRGTGRLRADVAREVSDLSYWCVIAHWQRYVSSSRQKVVSCVSPVHLQCMITRIILRMYVPSPPQTPVQCANLTKALVSSPRRTRVACIPSSPSVSNSIRMHG